MNALNMIIATRIPAAAAFDGAARSAESASAIVFRDGVNRILTGDEPGASTVVVAAEAWRGAESAVGGGALIWLLMRPKTA